MTLEFDHIISLILIDGRTWCRSSLPCPSGKQWCSVSPLLVVVIIVTALVVVLIVFAILVVIVAQPHRHTHRDRSVWNYHWNLLLP
mmetsp:Transcript_2444/g.3235  ORF Transcript_2444/g.3235 Transcript_2444/m.3235 type:complete len:86 (+) Transcript_2444:173-430(+)